MNTIRGNKLSIRRLRLLKLALLAASISALCLWARQGPFAPATDDENSSRLASSTAATIVEPAQPGGPGAATSPDESRVSAAPPALDATEATKQETAVLPADGPESLRRRLTNAIELSLSGALDPSAILGAALNLVELHVVKENLPSTAPDGSLRYALTPCPEGVHAELWVARSSGSTFENVVALRVQLDAPAEPYVLEGAVRKGPVVHVQAFVDEAGDMQNLVLMTDLAPSGRSRSFGLPLDEGRVPQGILFHADLDRPEEWTAESYGLEGGQDRTWEEPVALLGDPWSEPSALAQLGSGLLGLLSEARR